LTGSIAGELVAVDWRHIAPLTVYTRI